MVSPEGFQNDGEKAVDQLGGPQDGEEDPPVGEEQIQLLVPDVSWEDTTQMGCTQIQSKTPGMLDTLSPSREGLGIIE